MLHGCDVNNHWTELYNGGECSTALHVACQDGALDIVRLMMENGGKKLINGLTCVNLSSNFMCITTCDENGDLDF